MSLIILAYLGGVLTIVSPCILPVVPIVFSRADQPFVRSGLPLLIGMALTFAAVSTLAVASGAWVTQASQYGRWIALAVSGIFGFTLLLPAFAARVMQPFVNAGSRLAQLAGENAGNGRAFASLILGVATGLLWAPCAGPILGLVLTSAVVHKGGGGASGLLLSYAAGAATSLAIAMLAGGRVVAAMKRSLGLTERFRQGIGGAILVAVAALATGLDGRALTLLPTIATTGIETRLVAHLSPRTVSASKPADAEQAARAG
jgi:cytochrome c biogenesis protein CcdA